MSASEDVVAQAVRDLVASGAAEPWQFSPSDARRAARHRWAPFVAAHARHGRPGVPAARVATVLLVAALIVAVFITPWPPLHLFGSNPHPPVGPYASLPIVGESGTSACRSDNSAANVAQLVSPLAAVQFVTPQQGWVVGAGRILATEDAGKNWQVQYQGSAKLFGVDFVDVDHGFAIGTNQVLGTDNGGRQWSEVKEPCLAISSVYFTSPNVGYAVAGEFCNMVRPSRYAVANYSSPSTEVTSGASTTRHRHLSRARVSHRGLMAGLARQAKSGVRQTVDFAGRSPSPNRDVRGLLLNRATPRWCSVAGRVVPGSCFPAPVPPPGIPPMLPLPQRTGSSGVLCSRKDSPSPRSCP